MQSEEARKLSARCADYIERFPLLLLDEHENTNWADVSLTTFALYLGGTAIYWSADDHLPLLGKYWIAKLPSEEVMAILSQFEDIKAPPGFNTSGKILVSDPDFSAFHLLTRRPGEFPPRDIFGFYLLRLTGKSSASPGIPEALRFLATFYYSPATEWVPDGVEVALRPAGRSLSGRPDIPWPAGFPPLECATKDPGSEGYEIRLSREQFLELKPLLDARTREQAFLLSGKRFSLTVRYLFPHQLPSAATPHDTP